MKILYGKPYKIRLALHGKSYKENNQNPDSAERGVSRSALDGIPREEVTLEMKLEHSTESRVQRKHDYEAAIKLCRQIRDDCEALTADRLRAVELLLALEDED